MSVAVSGLGTGAQAQDGAAAIPGDEVIATGRFIPDPQRATSQIASFLRPEDLVRQGDANAALALTRVSGLSVIGGRFAYVRGLGDRYSSALLNGSPLPSPQPLRRTVPLDLFPSAILNNITVQKTFSPDYPGEFGGGIIDLRTLKSPPEDFLKFRIGTGVNTETTGKQSIFVRGGDHDTTGFDDGTRDIPAPLLAVLEAGQALNVQTDFDREVIGEFLADPNLMVIQSDDDTRPDLDISVDAGKIIPTRFGDIGFVGTVGFENGWSTKQKIRQKQANGRVVGALDTLESTFETTLNALASTSVTFDSGESVQGTVFYVHDTSKEAQIDEGRSVNEEILVEKNGYYERELFFAQLNGEHFFGDLTANWRGAYSVATRDAPFEREFERERNDASGQFLFPGDNAHRIRFTEVEDEVRSGGIDFNYFTLLRGSWETDFSIGVDYAGTDREFAVLNLKYDALTQLDPHIAATRVDVLFDAATIGPLFQIQEEQIRTTDNYSGELNVLGVYGKVDIEFSPTVRADVGVRYEESRLDVIAFDRFSRTNAQGLGRASLENDYLLPSASFTWNFMPDTQLRLGYSNTITRPQFRELALSRFLDPENDRLYNGNPNLVDSGFTNLDARIEHYFGRDQFFAFAGFYKDIENPIEESTFETSANNFETSFINAPAAVLSGFEAEFRTNFDMPFGGEFFDVRDWFFTVNYTYTDATVKAGPDDTITDARGKRTPANLFGIDGQPLQGTPENIANGQFGWETDNEQFTILAGWVDDRVSRRGIRGSSAVPDVIESPGVQLDLVYRRKFRLHNRRFSLGLSARNFLNMDFEEFQTSEEAGRTEFNTYRRGVSFSVSLSTGL